MHVIGLLKLGVSILKVYKEYPVTFGIKYEVFHWVELYKLNLGSFLVLLFKFFVSYLNSKNCFSINL